MFYGRDRYLQLLILLSILFFQVAELFASQYWPQEQWRTASPESQGMSSKILSELFRAIRKHDYKIDSVMIVRNGYVVLESYSYLQEPHFKHQIYSCTKSVSSALIGIAIDKGYIKSVDQTLLELFPERTPRIQQSDKPSPGTRVVRNSAPFRGPSVSYRGCRSWACEFHGSCWPGRRFWSGWRFL